MIYDATTRIAEAALRMRARMGGSAALRERLVCGTPPGPAAIWIHAASVGELTSARRIIRALADRHRVQITTNSETGRDLARGWDLPARLAPLDLPGTLARFLGAVRPRLALTVEGEFWPLRSRLLAQGGVAQAMIGARMSERSAGTWGRFPRVIGPMLGRIDALSAQDQGSEARLLSLGLPHRALMPRLDLKLLDPAALPLPPSDAGRDAVILAASTHEGEDGPILDAFAALRGVRPDLRLILAPRHPGRGPAIAGLIAARDLPMARRGEGAADAPPGGVLLADTLGEMPRWYARAGLCIIGGSLADHGGHTPWEPAAHGCALIHGPHVANFLDAFDSLDAHGAARPAGDLTGTLARLLDHPAEARAMGAAARRVLDDRAGDPGGLIARLDGLASATA
ncbi:3-deoxy-D-manno-octulosonic acid transferase [Paracoccus aestuarii]|uniref:3-deoxy-D-manno-octulosonic acid transferase n=1 Tax=Paracoccus aestuarii TaxID=453842 RepID=A0A418ZQ44_9RHOB|nr:glycosyltransferase N-terminal domain-containing protein [Paracoccus aestuarii]RJK96207.1 3-deoxy-D-manno-octulosonic acid transferase [Paracoccus aestuarii]WCQ99952.1 3-deoxy-D-manno-octulosonic acid transferase [Paracoccus aestuarii]